MNMQGLQIILLTNCLEKMFALQTVSEKRNKEGKMAEERYDRILLVMLMIRFLMFFFQSLLKLVEVMYRQCVGSNPLDVRQGRRLPVLIQPSSKMQWEVHA